MIDWIDVRDALPDVADAVLVALPDGHYAVAELDSNQRWWWALAGDDCAADSYGNLIQFGDVTHWAWISAPEEQNLRTEAQP